jgi:hypothetical protein
MKESFKEYRERLGRKNEKSIALAVDLPGTTYKVVRKVATKGILLFLYFLFRKEKNQFTTYE